MKQKACYVQFLNFMQEMLERKSVTYDFRSMWINYYEKGIWEYL